MVVGVGFSLSSCVFNCLQARVMTIVLTVVTGVLCAGVLRGVGSDEEGGLVGITIGHKGERWVGKIFWRGLGGLGAPSRRQTPLPGCVATIVCAVSNFFSQWITGHIC